MPFRSLVLVVFLTAKLFADAAPTSVVPPKSLCTKHSHGRLWPPEANDDRHLLQVKAVAGELFMCEGDYDSDAYFPSVVHKFTWRALTVRVSELKPLGKTAASGQSAQSTPAIP